MNEIYKTIKDVATKYNISSRTVRRFIERVDLKDRSKYIKKQGKRIVIDIKWFECNYFSYKKKKKKDIKHSPKKRNRNIDFLEKDLEDFIWKMILEKKIDLLAEKGLLLNESSNYFRQLNLYNYGIADIIGINIEKLDPKTYNIHINVIELKKEAINEYTISQACKYASGLKHYFSESIGLNFNIDFKITLIGSKLSKSKNLPYVIDFLGNVDIYTYSFNLDNGIEFNKKANNIFTGLKCEKNINIDFKDFLGNEFT